jgi:hypothetical protein
MNIAFSVHIQALRDRMRKGCDWGEMSSAEDRGASGWQPLFEDVDRHPESAVRYDRPHFRVDDIVMELPNGDGSSN